MRVWIIMAAINGALSVGLGAYAAHGFAPATQAYEIGLMEKATRYQMYHALALLAVGGLAARRPESRLVALAGGLFSLGILLFCGSLYVIALSGLAVGGVAPFGGSALIAGWLSLIAVALTEKSRAKWS